MKIFNKSWIFFEIGFIEFFEDLFHCNFIDLGVGIEPFEVLIDVREDSWPVSGKLKLIFCPSLLCIQFTLVELPCNILFQCKLCVFNYHVFFLFVVNSSIRSDWFHRPFDFRFYITIKIRHSLNQRNLISIHLTFSSLI